MVELPDAAAYPEAMMVKLSHTAIALPAVTASERLHELASLTVASLWQLNSMIMHSFYRLNTAAFFAFFNYNIHVALTHHTSSCLWVIVGEGRFEVCNL